MGTLVPMMTRPRFFQVNIMLTCPYLLLIYTSYLNASTSSQNKVPSCCWRISLGGLC